MTKVFSKGLMASEDVQSFVKSAKFYAEDAYAEIDDGSFVVLGDLDVDNVYSTQTFTAVDYNVYKATAPAAVTDPVWIVDIADISQGVIAGNNYKIGDKLVDLKARPGFAVRVRRPVLGDMFWLGEGGFVAAPGENKYATLTANDTRLTAAAAATANGFTVKIQATKDLVVGQSVYKNDDDSYEQLYLCEVVKL